MRPDSATLRLRYRLVVMQSTAATPLDSIFCIHVLPSSHLTVNQTPIHIDPNRSLAPDVPLRWDSRSQYDTDGVPGTPNSGLGTWINLTPIGGHPNGANPIQRHAIARWTVPSEGVYGEFRIVHIHAAC